uniref:Uncharacterized protein n=1 Tax=Anguilla anguilla TaxID=7936 RepID=A0A0E9S505_ANGAN
MQLLYEICHRDILLTFIHNSWFSSLCCTGFSLRQAFFFLNKCFTW